MSRSLLVGLLLTLAGVSTASAQPDSARITISGNVVDPTRHPISSAEIMVVGSGRSAFSKENGRFQLVAQRSTAPVLIQVRRPGFKAQLLRVSDSWNGTIVLEPGAYELPEIQVTARYAKPVEYAETAKYDEVFRRRRLGMGELIDRSEIERRGTGRVAEVLEGRRGIRVQSRPIGVFTGTVVSFSRCNEFPPRINVYIDGRKVLPDQAPLLLVESSSPNHRAVAEDFRTLDARARVQAQVGEMLDRVTTSDVEFIEVFRGISELPGEFSDGNCGAIALWTRQGGRR